MKEFYALLDRRNAEQKNLDRRTGTVAWAIHNCMSKRKDGETWKITDFMPQQEEREQTPEEMLALLQLITPEE